MSTRKWFVGAVVVLAVLIILVLAVGLTQAQGPEPPEGEAGAEGEAVSSVIPIQGRLTDANGNPLDGSYTITARIYDAETGGAVLCWSTAVGVPVDNGLFNMDVYFCSASEINGRQLYLGIEVAGDGEMTPRQAIYPVPYAWSLRPGAIISDTSDVILTVRSTGTGDADALIADASGTGEAIEAYAKDGIGVFAKSDTYLALQAYSYDNADHPGVFGCSAASADICDPYRDDNGAGVMGYSHTDYGVYAVGGTSADGGIYAESKSTNGAGVWAENGANGIAILADTNSSGNLLPTLYLVQRNDTGSGNFVVAADSVGGDRLWRVDGTGKGFFDGGTQTGGADFAEQMAVEGEEAECEPADVLVISASADRAVERSSAPFATAVIGVYSTKPAVLAGAPDTDDPLDGVPVAITGIVPCKVSVENGPIRRGDLLVTSSTPGHAMRAGDNPPQGTVLGKALGELKEGVGVIEILVTLQ